MIKIKKSPIADTRTCDFTSVTKEQLLRSSKQHIADVQSAMFHFMFLIKAAAEAHDHTKLSQIDGFHADFLTGFKSTKWWDNHRKQERHHLGQLDGVRDDVNLIDVLEYVADCVMAGMARSGTVYDIAIDSDVLMRAFKNTCELLKREVAVDADRIEKEGVS
jgi:hypothetical protein